MKSTHRTLSWLSILQQVMFIAMTANLVSSADESKLAFAQRLDDNTTITVGDDFGTNDPNSTSSIAFPSRSQQETSVDKPGRKVQVNVLYLSQATDTPMFLRETFGDDTTLPNSTLVDETNSSVTWLGNSRLEYIDVHVVLRDTKYRPEFNLRKTFGVILEQLAASPSFASSSVQAPAVRNVSSDVGSAVTCSPVINIIVGPVYSGEAKAMSLFTSFYNLVLVSGSASSPALADRTRYPYFFRTCPSDGDGPNVLANVLRYFGYNQLNMLYFDEGFVLDLKEMLAPNFRSRGIIIENSFILYQHDNRSFSHMGEVLRASSTQSHIWMTFLSSDDYANYDLLCALSQYGHIDGSTHLGFVFGEATSEEAQWWNPPASSAADNITSGSSKYLYAGVCSAAQLRTVLNGAIHITQSAADYADRKADLVDLRPSEFRRRMRVALDTNGYGADSFYSYLFFQFDAFTAAAMALDRVERTLRTQFNTSLAHFRYNDSRVVKSVFDNLSNMSFQGLTGLVEFDTDGNRERVGWILRQFQDSAFVTVGAYEATNATAFNVTLIKPLVFPTPDGKAPPQFVFTSWATSTNIALIVVAGLLVVFGVPLLVWFVRRLRSEAALRSALQNTSHWLIDTEMLISDNALLNRSSRLSLLTSGQSSVMSVRSGLRSQRSLSMSGASGAAVTANGRRPYLTFIYKQSNSSSRVCLFPLKRANDAKNRRQLSGSKLPEHYLNDDNITIDREFLSALVRTQECQHDNLSRFVGVTPIMLENITSYHVTMAGFSSKGSLTDFINQTRATGDVMDVACSFSMLKDLQKGLAEVHRQLGFHGRLSSTVCMIDNRLSLRLSDFGFTQYRQAAFFPSRHSRHATIEYEDWLWTAPEVLARQFGVQSKTISDLNSVSELPSELPLDWQLCDMFSFGIIVVEIFSSYHPFNGEWLDSTTTLELLRSIVDNPSQISTMVHDTCTENDVADDAKAFIQRCVSVDPKARLPLAEAGAALNTMMRARKLSDNLTEMLMQRLEMYAANLESVVEQRTVALVEEENKVRRLLYQILPPTVADALKNGESVLPQTFSSVTIYFSDIVGFTTISAQSSPLQVVDLLNDLYNAFDKILSTFDVYKVETIGDAYMVVSGLPKPNGDDHVLNIARMSATLIDHVTGNFRIRHKPDEQLKLRIGMHTGGCAAGVVGFVMPRYCLFGDTVNTASRMESTGEPLRIHASEASAKALQELGVVVGGKFSGEGELLAGALTPGLPEFELSERGLVEVKGKGNMRTFWLAKKKTNFNFDETK